jgi:hypothetical protein
MRREFGHFTMSSIREFLSLASLNFSISGSFDYSSSNIHPRETAIGRRDDETPNDRNDRGIVYNISLDHWESNVYFRNSQGYGLVHATSQVYQTKDARAFNPTPGHRTPHRGCCKHGEGSEGGYHHNDGLVCTTSSLTLVFYIFGSVRQYVEGMANATQLLDLLAAEGSEEIEPTMAAARRRTLYFEVFCYSLLLCSSY